MQGLSGRHKWYTRETGQSTFSSFRPQTGSIAIYDCNAILSAILEGAGLRIPVVETRSFAVHKCWVSNNSDHGSNFLPANLLVSLQRIIIIIATMCEFGIIVFPPNTDDAIGDPALEDDSEVPPARRGRQIDHDANRMWRNG